MKIDLRKQKNEGDMVRWIKEEGEKNEYVIINNDE